MIIDVLEQVAGPQLRPFCTFEVRGLARYNPRTDEYELSEDELADDGAAAEFSLRYLGGRMLDEDTEARLVDRLEIGDDCGEVDGFRWYRRMPTLSPSLS